MVLLFCYDDNFIGDRHPITALVAFRLPCRITIYVPKIDKYQSMGIRSPFFYCYSSRILDFRRSYGKMECLPRNLGGTNDIPIRNDYHFLAFIVLVTFYGIIHQNKKHYNSFKRSFIYFYADKPKGVLQVRFEAFTKIKRVIHSYFISYFTYIVIYPPAKVP